MVYRPPADQIQTRRIRVAAVVLREDHILLVAHQFVDGPLAWLLPGGGVELGETVVEAVVREVQEETGLEVEVGRLLFWREFFDWRHSLELIFLTQPTGGQLHVGHDPEFDDQVIREVKWFPLAELSQVDIVPSALRQSLVGAWRTDFQNPTSYLGLTESFAEVLRGWQPGNPPF